MTSTTTNLIIRFFSASIMCFVAFAGAACAEDPITKSPVLFDEEMRSFENKVRPLLAEK